MQHHGAGLRDLTDDEEDPILHRMRQSDKRKGKKRKNVKSVKWKDGLSSDRERKKEILEQVFIIPALPPKERTPTTNNSNTNTSGNSHSGKGSDNDAAAKAAAVQVGTNQELTGQAKKGTETPTNGTASISMNLEDNGNGDDSAELEDEEDMFDYDDSLLL